MHDAGLLDRLVPARAAARERTLAELLSEAGLPAVAGAAFVRATGLVHDSRLAGHGDVFVAVRGARDGAEYAAEAVSRGAVAVVASSGDRGVGVPWIEVDDDRAALADLAAALHGRPSHKMLVAGVTGTNGKTTTTFAAASVLGSAGASVGIVGTIETRWPGRIVPASRTTPEASDLQRLLADMADDGCAAAVMEVSSHAVDLQRVRGVRFAALAFTNLSQDHLDWHGDLETYYRSKRRLFTDLAPEAPVVACVDDEGGARLVRDLRAARGDRDVLTVGFADAASLRIVAFEGSAGGSRFRLQGAHAGARLDIPVRLALPGRHNAQNAAIAAGLGLALGAPPELVESGLAEIAGVPGRLELVSEPGEGPAVFVDFAHTPGALEGVLRAAREFTRGRLICLFGCGGDKDREKRPLMGEAVGRLADVAVATSDNPRTEDPLAILEQAVAGLRRGTAQVHVEADRRAAIETALAMARPGDVVILAGKGHETCQEIGSRRIPFDDRVVAREILARRQS